MTALRDRIAEAIYAIDPAGRVESVNLSFDTFNGRLAGKWTAIPWGEASEATRAKANRQADAVLAELRKGLQWSPNDPYKLLLNGERVGAVWLDVLTVPPFGWGLLDRDGGQVETKEAAREALMSKAIKWLES